MGLRWGLGVLVFATLAQVFVLTANASPDTFRVAGRAVVGKTGEPIAGMPIKLYIKEPGQPGQIIDPIAQAITEENGRFVLIVRRTTRFPLVTIVVEPHGLACEAVALVGVIGAATAYAALREDPGFHARANDKLNKDATYSTFEMTGEINPDGSCTGSIGLYRTKEEE